MNLVAAESDAHRTAIAYAAREERPEAVIGALRRLRMPARHPVMVTEDVAGPRVARILLETYERRPASFEELLGIAFLEAAVRPARLGERDRLDALRRLASLEL